MDELLDSLWLKIVEAANYAVAALDFVFSPLDYLEPTAAVFVIAGLTVALTKFLSAKFKTKRYYELQKEFRYWYELRQEAVNHPDREKGQRLARNIDQAKLNKAYYDFFFEGFLINLVTKYLPFLIMLAYVNEAYSPQRLLERFGRDHLFQFPGPDAAPVAVGSLFWFVVSFVLIVLAWAVVARRLARRAARTDDSARAAD